MYIIDQFSGDNEEFYHEVIKNFTLKKRGRISGLQKELFKAYKRFEGTNLNPFLLNELNPIRVSKVRKSILQDFYKSKYVKRYVFGENYSFDEKPWCAYCSCRPSSEVEHYLGKEEFPEFSILPNNLLPICDKCNQRKNNSRISSVGGPLFINPKISSAVLNLSYNFSLGVENNLDSGASVIYVKISPTVNQEFQRVLNSHFERLGVIASMELILNKALHKACRLYREISSTSMPIEEQKEKIKKLIIEENLERVYAINPSILSEFSIFLVDDQNFNILEAYS